MCVFVQLHFNFRNDISIVPLALLDRPSFNIQLLENKDSEYLRGLDLGLTKEQILDMHPYKWDTTTVSIPISLQISQKYSLPLHYTMEWVIVPDLYSERQVTRIDDAQIKKQAYLSPTRAMLVNIIETNKWNRPIYFTNNFEYYFLAGLDEYFQNCGLVSVLTPIKTENTSFQIHLPTLEKFVLHTNLKKYPDIILNDQPRISWNMKNYEKSYLTLAQYYKTIGEQDKILEIIKCYKQNLQIGFDVKNEQEILNTLEELKE